MTLGLKIRTLRESKDLSLREFARRIHVTAAFLSDIELGRRFPSEDVLQKIAEGLGAALSDLKNLDSRPPLDEIRRLSAINPTFGLALRRIVEEKISPDELLRIANKRSRKGSEKK